MSAAIRLAGQAEAPATASTLLDGARLEDMERQAILSAVSHAKGNISRAAKALGISRSTLYVKLANLRGPAQKQEHRH